MISKKALAGAAVAAVALAAITGTVAAQDIELQQITDTEAAAPGDQIQVTYDINATGLQAPALDARVPPNWSLSSVENQGASFRSSERQWIWLAGGSYSPAYTLQVPETAPPGRYLVLAEASGVEPATGDRKVATTQTAIEVSADERRGLEFGHDPQSPRINQTVTFTAASQEDVQEYSWTFGDSSGQGETTTYTYVTPGSKVAILTATYAGGDRETVEKLVIDAVDQGTRSIPIGPPISRFTYSPSTPSVDEEITFDASESYDREGEVVSYEWDLDQDGDYESSGAEVSKTYEAEGNYTARLRVGDQSGATNVTSRRVVVEGESTGDLPIAGIVIAGLVAVVIVALIAREVN